MQVLTPQCPHLFNTTTYETTHLLLHVLIYLQFRSGQISDLALSVLKHYCSKIVPIYLYQLSNVVQIDHRSTAITYLLSYIL